MGDQPGLIAKAGSDAIEFVVQAETWPVFWEFLKRKHYDSDAEKEGQCPICLGKSADLRKAFACAGAIMHHAYATGDKS